MKGPLVGQGLSGPPDVEHMMKFDSNLAWTEAMAAVRANREVLMALAGVFFLLPALLSSVFLTDIQTKVMESVGNPDAMNRIMADGMGKLFLFGLGGSILQMLGYLSVTSLISDRSRLTVLEALKVALRALPSFFAVGILSMIAMSFALAAFSIVIVGVFSIVGAGGLGSTVAVVALILLMIFGAIRLSLVGPVIVNDGIKNPIAAMRRSWVLTKGNTPRLASFYALLMVVYFALTLLSTVVLVGPIILILGQGGTSLLLMGLVSGGIGAVMSVIMTAVIAQTHLQLAGPSEGSVTNTFS